MFLPKVFQFLLVRLIAPDELCNSCQSSISIPFGSINSLNEDVFISVLAISIPFGSINSLNEDVFISVLAISIPFGSINRAHPPVPA